MMSNFVVDMNRFEIRSVHVTQEDIDSARLDEQPDPLVAALRRATGTPWKMSGWGVALEMAIPYRTIVLPGVALKAWQIFQHTGTVEPLEFTAEICTPVEKSPSVPPMPQTPADRTQV